MACRHEGAGHADADDRRGLGSGCRYLPQGAVPAWAKGKNDRRFLEAVHFFTVHSITWRALPAEFGNWNSIWKRFSRLSRAGTFEAFFQALAGCNRSAGLIQMFDSTSVRAHVSAAGAKGAGKSGAWALPRRVWDKDPRHVRPRGPSARLPPYGEPGERHDAIRAPPRQRPGRHPARRDRRQRV